MKVGKQYKLKSGCFECVWFIKESRTHLSRQDFENAVYTVTDVESSTGGASCKADNDAIPAQYFSTDEMIYFKKVKKSIDKNQ